MKLQFSADYKVKFRAFGITFWQTSGSLKETYKVPTFGKKNIPVDLPGPLDLVLVLDGKNLAATVTAVFEGFPVYSYDINLKDLVAGQELVLDGFDVRGVALTNIKLKVLV